MDIQQIISENIESWKDVSGSSDLDGIFEVANQLAINSYHLGSHVSLLYGLYLDAENNYKLAIDTHIFEAKQGTSKAAAEAEAKVKYNDLKREMIECEWRYKQANHQLYQANVLIQHIRQYISYLKSEKEQSLRS